ncbi:MAG: hypothetical protein QOE26_178 [Verrucomicrobiota bacterium]|jgi:hypothetical protein
MNRELQETRELVNVLNRFVENYERSAPRTDALALKCAAARAREALTDCLSKALVELDGGREDFECGACGGMHDLARDRELLLSGTFRGPIAHADAPKVTPDYVVLMRGRRYSVGHAKEVVRQLELRGYQSPAANVELVPA